MLPFGKKMEERTKFTCELTMILELCLWSPRALKGVGGLVTQASPLLG